MNASDQKSETCTSESGCATSVDKSSSEEKKQNKDSIVSSMKGASATAASNKNSSTATTTESKNLIVCNNKFCKKTGNLMQCTGCRNVHYCCLACQQADWRFHMWVCGKDMSGNDKPSGVSTCKVDNSPDTNIEIIMEESSQSNITTANTQKPLKNDKNFTYVRWSTEEQDLFLEGLEQHGRSWKDIASHVKTRSAEQVCGYGNCYLKKTDCYWTTKEHQLFLEGLKQHGRARWEEIATHVGTKNHEQVSFHANEYFKEEEMHEKSEKKNIRVEDSVRAMKMSRRRWSAEEHDRFLEGLEQHGTSWKDIASHVKTRTREQVRKYGHQYLKKLDCFWTTKEHLRFLEGLQQYGRGCWVEIASHVGTKNSEQVSFRAKEYFEEMNEESQKTDRSKKDSIVTREFVTIPTHGNYSYSNANRSIDQKFPANKNSNEIKIGQQNDKQRIVTPENDTEDGVNMQNMDNTNSLKSCRNRKEAICNDSALKNYEKTFDPQKKNEATCNDSTKDKGRHFLEVERAKVNTNSASAIANKNADELSNDAIATDDHQTNFVEKNEVIDVPESIQVCMKEKEQTSEARNEKKNSSSDEEKWSSHKKTADGPLFSYHIIDSCDPTIASWSDSGDSFAVKDPEIFATTIIPQFFNHNEFSSFVRQLNVYGLRKIKNEPMKISKEEEGPESKYWGFRHDFFLKGRQDLLCEIKKVDHSEGAEQEEVNALKNEVAYLKGRLAAMQTKMDFEEKGINGKPQKTVERNEKDFLSTREVFCEESSQTNAKRSRDQVDTTSQSSKKRKSMESIREKNTVQSIVTPEKDADQEKMHNVIFSLKPIHQKTNELQNGHGASCSDSEITTDVHDTSCPICFEMFNDPYIVPECCHRFCKGCIEEALEYRRECPICRGRVTSRRALRRDEVFDNLMRVSEEHKVKNFAASAQLLEKIDRIQHLESRQKEDEEKLQHYCKKNEEKNIKNKILEKQIRTLLQKNERLVTKLQQQNDIIKNLKSRQKADVEHHQNMAALATNHLKTQLKVKKFRIKTFEKEIEQNDVKFKKKLQEKNDRIQFLASRQKADKRKLQCLSQTSKHLETQLEEEKTRSDAFEKVARTLSDEHEIESMAAAVRDLQSQLQEKNERIQFLESNNEKVKEKLSTNDRNLSTHIEEVK